MGWFCFTNSSTSANGVRVRLQKGAIIDLFLADVEHVAPGKRTGTYVYSRGERNTGRSTKMERIQQVYSRLKCNTIIGYDQWVDQWAHPWFKTSNG